MIDYETTIDSKGEVLSLYDKYLVANDGTFVFPDKDDIYDFLIREYWPDELAVPEQFKKDFHKEFKVAAGSVYNDATCDWYWKECDLDKTLNEYGLEFLK